MEYEYDGYEHELQTDSEYMYQDDEEEEDEDVEYTNMTLEQLVLMCIRPTLSQTVNSLSFLIVWNIVFR